LPHTHQDKLLSEKIMLPATRGCTIRSGDAHRSISRMGRLVRAFDPASRRPGPGRTGADEPGDPASSRPRRERWGEPVAVEPGARPRRQKPPGHRGLGASERRGRTHRPVAERAAAPLGGIPGRHHASAAGGTIAGPTVAVVWALPAHRRWQLPEPTRQHRHRLAPARGVRPGSWRLQPPGADRSARRGVAAALRAGGRRGADCRPRLRQGQGVARLSRSVGHRFAGLHCAGRLAGAGAVRCRGQTVQSDRPSG
jgi:hypothetical protein